METSSSLQTSVFDSVDDYNAALGSFWSGEYNGLDQVSTITQSSLEVAKQLGADNEDYVATFARRYVRPFRKQQWYRIKLKLGDRQHSPRYLSTGPKAYDQGWRYAGSAMYKRYRYKLPAGLADVPVLTDNVAKPTFVLTAGVDYVVDAGYLYCDVDFMAHGDEPLPSVHLWAYGAERDFEDMYRLFGYAVGLKSQPSRQYCRLVNAYWDAAVSGPTEACIREYIAACFDVPISQYADERFLFARTTAGESTVVTNRGAYKEPGNPNPVFSADNLIGKHKPLTATLQFFPSLLAANLPKLVLPLTWMDGCLKLPFVLDNLEKTVLLSTVGGYTAAAWESSCDEATATQFFDLCHSRGVAAAAKPTDGLPSRRLVQLPNSTYRRGTIAHWLDTRAELRSEPTANTLPATINPYKYFARNVFGSNVQVVRVKLNRLRGCELESLHRIKQLLPAFAGIIFLIEYSSPVTAAVLKRRLKDMASVVDGDAGQIFATV